VEIAIALYHGVTALDAIGPYEPLSRLPGAEIRFVTEEIISTVHQRPHRLLPRPPL
jgi:hypothetical protein